MLEVVTLKEIDAIFVVTDALEITVEAERPLDEWRAELPRLIAAARGK